MEYSSDFRKQLCTASEQGDLSAVQTLLQHNDIKVDCVDGESGITPLQLAAANGHEDVVRQLIMGGAALDCKNFYGWTALMQAASYGHDKVVALLLQNKADFKLKNNLGASALTVAARFGHTAVVKRLLDTGIDVNDGTSNINQGFYSKGIGATPLIVASQFGHDAIMRALLDRGSNPKHKNETTGWNALMFAALNGHMTSAQILVDRGCDPNETNYIGKTAYEVAMCAGKREAAGYLDRKTTTRPKIVPTTSKPKIIEAAETGDLRLITQILDEDPTQVDTVSPEGATSLMIAAMLGRIDIAKMLLHRGADINKQDSKNGWTSLMQATFFRHTEFVKFLLNQNADASLKAQDRCTALDLVICLPDSDTELTRMLASAAMPVQGSAASSRSPKNNTGSGTWLTKSDKPLPDEKPKGGLKAWWNRLSNRFQNLKLSRTLMSGMTTTKLTPFHDENNVTDSAVSIDKEKSDASIQRNGKKKRKSSEQKDDLFLKSIISNDSGLSSTSQSIQSLSILSPMSTFQSDKLLPVVPPFHPPPTFDPNDRSKRPMNASRTSLSMLANGKNVGPRQPHMKSKGLFTRPHNKSISPSNSNNFSTTTSPNSSGGASSISRLHKPTRLPGSHSKINSESKHGLESPESKAYPDIAFLPQSAFKISPKSQVNFNEPSSPVSPTSQTSGLNNSSTSSTISGSATPSKQRPLSGTSLGSTTPTLTPSPSPSPKGRPGSNHSSASQASSTLQPKHSSSSGVSEDDELSALLRKLSLEKYSPIFEEQEVDMEAFLSLDKSDLTELGIKQSEPQSRILLAINELNSGRNRDFKT
ncbi:ankyrin repeat and SAM domain-containing protein 6-like isoform X1 [Antedon mediterranea]|uniref:ankyrin repeat and SAM domain-containing protein 6-like isoform X1 n=1 Tax=Antedon mediterranea TaxID=105859 RepID=UPI003AF74C23